MRALTAAPHGTARAPAEIREGRRTESRGALPGRAEGPRGAAEPLFARAEPPRRFGSAGDLGLFSCVVPSTDRAFCLLLLFTFLPRAFPRWIWTEGGSLQRSSSRQNIFEPRVLGAWHRLFVFLWVVCVCVCVSE